ncbi:hypothetical protein [Streptomyces sp. NPDC058872]|uniref:hypothetical protein n=1 Tax=Streptomyces sp. NPDC058872 TaxID=3346661 RepID=UPI0036A6C315
MTIAPAHPVPVISIAGPPLASAACLFGDCGWGVGPLEVAQVTAHCAEHQRNRGHGIFARSIEDVVLIR